MCQSLSHSVFSLRPLHLTDVCAELSVLVSLAPPGPEDRDQLHEMGTATYLLGQGYSALTLQGLEPAGFLFHLILNCTHLVSQVYTSLWLERCKAKMQWNWHRGPEFSLKVLKGGEGEIERGRRRVRQVAAGGKVYTRGVQLLPYEVRSLLVFCSTW